MDKLEQIIIHPLEEKDIEHLKEILLPMWLMHAEKKSGLWSQEEIKEADFKKIFSEYIDSPKKIFYVATTPDNKIVGTIDGEIEETPCFYKEKRSLYISDLMVLDDFRNKGVATTLTKACLDFAKNNNVKLITSRIYQFNQESQSLIKKLGFEPDFTHYSYKAK